MVRYKLKGHFVEVARNQILGGVWFKPTWWNAVRRVPPGNFLPRPGNKRHLREIRFPEDTLIREFRQRNPMITVRDRGVPQSKGFTDRIRPEVSKTVAWNFVDAQVGYLDAGHSKEQAYRLAERAMIRRGKELVKSVVTTKAERTKWDSYELAISGETEEERQQAMIRQIMALQAPKEVKARDMLPQKLQQDWRIWQDQSTIAPGEARRHNVARRLLDVSREDVLSRDAYKVFLEDQRTSQLRRRHQRTISEFRKWLAEQEAAQAEAAEGSYPSSFDPVVPSTMGESGMRPEPRLSTSGDLEDWDDFDFGGDPVLDVDPTKAWEEDFEDSE